MPVLDDDGPPQDVIYAGCAIPAEAWTEQCRSCHATFGTLTLGTGGAAAGSPWDGLD